MGIYWTSIKSGNQQDMCDSLDMDTRGEKTGKKAKDNLEKDSRI